MQILPSLLEYSSFGLEQKIASIHQHKNDFLRLAHQKKISLHLDFVLEQFAKDRSVMKSSGLDLVFGALQNQFWDQEIYLSIHLMGDSEDLLEAYRYFDGHNFNPKWHYLILVPDKFTRTWTNLIKKNSPKDKIGTWLDLNEWDNFKFKTGQHYLLMTVLAGKSGQKLIEQTKSKVLSLVRQYPKSKFLLDGGWNIHDLDEAVKNVDLVSYSSFWKEFLI
jgi:hypothetical protein